jgi:telomerase Cajal body protein 1
MEEPTQQMSEEIEMEEQIEMEEKEAEGDQSVALTKESPFRFDAAPLRLYHFAHQFRTSGPNNSSNFLKGVKWAPDGSCFLTCSDDNSLRLFYLCVRFFP